jgi:hypothetical protein
MEGLQDYLYPLWVQEQNNATTPPVIDDIMHISIWDAAGEKSRNMQ